MLFNSLEFLVFFPAVVLLYWILTPKLRNVMLLIASYYFYMNWQPVYALLILLSTTTTYIGGLLINDRPEHKKAWIWSSIIINISILFLFKYLTFAADTLQHLMDAAGLGIHIPQFTLLLPVGISFYTFQAIGYLVDVYRQDIKAERNFFTYALFVSFFPQLVAGPIERASNLLPQFHNRHHFNADHLIDGLRTMTWGYFMKLCIAECVAPYVNAVFNNIDMHGCTSIWLATFFFTFQIFCDFGGYSLIAIGTARCIGFNLMQNFRQPYLARNVKDFWRRWHISLSSWLSDYIYKPLGGSRCSTAKHQRNLIITFLISGFWHGANWTFVAWGAYHGILQSGLSLKKRYIPAAGRPDKIIKALGITVTFFLMMLGWVLFRANSWADAMTAYHKMFHPDGAILYNGEGIVTFVLLDWVFGQIFSLYVDRFELKGDYESIDYLLNRCDDDIVVLGSSVGLNSINTKQLQDSLGITSFNGGANAQTFPYFLTTLKALTSHQQKPELVILCISPNNLTSSGIGDRYNILAPYYNRNISDIDSCLETRSPHERLFLSSNSYRLNTIWFRIFLYNFITAGLTGENGFIAKPIPPTFPTRNDSDNLSAPITPERQAEITQFINLCQSDDIRLMIILTPQYIYSDPTVADQLFDICNRHGITFYNDIHHPRFNSDSTMFYDNLHLNINGADIYTQIIIDRIRQKFSLQ